MTENVEFITHRVTFDPRILENLYQMFDSNSTSQLLIIAFQKNIEQRFVIIFIYFLNITFVYKNSIKYTLSKTNYYC